MKIFNTTIKVLSTKTMILLTLFLYIHTINAQDNNYIYGTWTFSDGPSFSRMSLDIKQHTDTIPGLKAEILSAYTGRRMTFSPNGDFEQSMASGERLFGKWAIIGNVLELYDPQGNSYSLLIGEIKSNRLVLIPPTSNDARPILPELYFTKN
ncbi:hypothetical protein [Flagellimonas beolgyonensis]|uniref:hypothetical protein n=1 Tax=Flagellimonas beolgyonensis TaxID=864064 RepID=UPI000F8D9026|nr:hypothetical protein [Allomuricauda beolgyonensis]